MRERVAGEKNTLQLATAQVRARMLCPATLLGCQRCQIPFAALLRAQHAPPFVGVVQSVLQHRCH